MKTTARLAHQSLRFDAAVRTHLVVSLTAPPVDASGKRRPVCVIPVIDVSGSMQGDKLHHAKQSVLKLMDHLGPGDRCGVVAFSTSVAVLSPAVEMTAAAKTALKLRVGDLGADSQTNLSGGILAGLGLGNDAELPPDTLVRVILFTDGQANQGIATTSEQLLPLLDARRGRATLSAFGYGRDADQELLSDLARRGGGNYAFIDNPDAAMSAFARELGGLLSTHATDLVVRVTPAPGARVVSVLSDVTAEDRGTCHELKCDDLLAEEERHLVLEVELASLAFPATVPAFQVDGRYAVVAGSAAELRTFAEAVAVDRVEPPFAQQHPDPALDLIVAQAQLLLAQLQAEAQAQVGNFQGATDRLYQEARVLDDRGFTELSQAAVKMADKMTDASAYACSAAMRKSVQAGMRRGGSSGFEPEAEELLRQAGKTHRTRAQAAMEASFGEPGTEPAKGSGVGGRTGAAPPTRSRPKGSSPGGAARQRSRRW